VGGMKMKLNDLIKRALVTADEIGNEAEYKEQLVEAINKVQNKLVVFARNKIKYEKVVAEDNVITLPNDCYELIEVKNSNLQNANFVKMNNNQIQVAIDGEYLTKYKAFLPKVTTDALEDFEIEIDPIAEECMVVGVASWIAVDNPELYGVLVNEYNNLLANLSQIPEAVNETGTEVVRVGGWYW
jgi:hypothetical protein